MSVESVDRLSKRGPRPPPPHPGPPPEKIKLTNACLIISIFSTAATFFFSEAKISSHENFLNRQPNSKSCTTCMRYPNIINQGSFERSFLLVYVAKIWLKSIGSFGLDGQIFKVRSGSIYFRYPLVDLNQVKFWRDLKCGRGKNFTRVERRIDL